MQAKSPAAARCVPICWSLWLALVSAAYLGAAGTAWAQSAAARVMVVSGQAKAVDTQGRERVLEKGAELFAGDKVQTGEASLAQIRMNDGGYLSVRANTEMVIDKFVYDEKDPTQSNFLVSLLRGGFRSITGLIGRNNPSGYQIRASTATIGIRGTDHEPVLVLDTPQAQLQAQAPPGLYDKVNDGETFITTASGVLALKRGDVGFAPLASNLPPQVLLKIPDFYKMDLKTDGRDPKDGGADAGKGGGNLLRPSVSARREAQAQAQGQPQAAEPANPVNPPARPTPPTAGMGSATTPVLTPEQKRAILQAINPTAPRNTAPGASPTPVTPNAPTVPIAPIAPTAPTPPPPTQR